MGRLSLLFILLLLSGCAQITGINSSENRLSQGWTSVHKEDMANQQPLYCYKTLAKPDCYDHPIPGREDQLVTQYPAPLRNKRHQGFLDFHDDEEFNEAVRQKHSQTPFQGQETEEPLS